MFRGCTLADDAVGAPHALPPGARDGVLTGHLGHRGGGDLRGELAGPRIPHPLGERAGRAGVPVGEAGSRSVASRRPPASR